MPCAAHELWTHGCDCVLPPIRTFTVGPGVPPGQPSAGVTTYGRVADCHRRLGISPTPEHASICSSIEQYATGGAICGRAFSPLPTRPRASAASRTPARRRLPRALHRRPQPRGRDPPTSTRCGGPPGAEDTRCRGDPVRRVVSARRTPPGGAAPPPRPGGRPRRTLPNRRRIRRRPRSRSARSSPPRRPRRPVARPRRRSAR